MATTPTLTGSQFFALGVTQLRAAFLTREDYANAFQSLVSIDPSAPAPIASASARTVVPDLAYFQLAADGSPQLVVPTTSPSFTTSPAPSPTPAGAGADLSATTPGAGAPSGAITVPAGAPCPQGFVTSPGTTEQQIRSALELLPAPEISELDIIGACVPAPGVVAVGQWITANDFLWIRVYTTVGTSGLTLVTRVLDCQGVTHYMTNSLDGATVGVATTFIVSLTPGYLLSVCVSDMGSSLTGTQTFVSLGLQHSAQTGTAPEVILAQGYVTGLYGVSWPSNPAGGPTPVTVTPAPVAVVALVQARAGINQSGRTVVVTLPQPVTAGNTLLAFSISNGSGTHLVSDSQSNTWTGIAAWIYTSVYIAGNVAGGTTAITFDNGVGFNASINFHVMEISGLDFTLPYDVIGHNPSLGSVTATTGATTYGDVAAVLDGASTITGASGSGIPTGWQLVLDSSTTDGFRLLSLINLNESAPPATWTYTGYLPHSDAMIVLPTLHVRGG